MAHYRIYYVDKHGSIESGYDAECDGDDDALDVGCRLLKSHPRIEVWRGTQFVGSLTGAEMSLCQPRVFPLLYESRDRNSD